MADIAAIFGGWCVYTEKEVEKKKRRLAKSNDGDVVFFNINKYILPLKGKPIIQYVLDAVSGSSIFSDIHIYNDIFDIAENIDTRLYGGLRVHQMSFDVGKNIKDFYSQLEYGDRGHVWYGDLPMLKPEHVRMLYDESNALLGRPDVDGEPTRLVFSLAEYKNVARNSQFPNRMVRYDQLESPGTLDRLLMRFAKHDEYKMWIPVRDGGVSRNVRVANTFTFEKCEETDSFFDSEIPDFIYGTRKLLAAIGTVAYTLTRYGKWGLIADYFADRLDIDNAVHEAKDVLGRKFGVDFGFGIKFNISKAGAELENDVDSPMDYRHLSPDDFERFANRNL